MDSPKSILITGASSGIGRALALAYAEDGRSLALGGRDRERLQSVTEACRARGAAVASTAIDVRDTDAMAEWIAEIDRGNPLDLVVANAGISQGTGGAGEADAQIRRIFAVNIDGTLNTALPAIAAMRPRRRGQIALMSSFASFRGFPGAPSYCASKAAIRSFGEGLRGAVWADGIRVSVICPGFVRSAMTDANDFPMPWMMSAERAAAIIARGLARDRARISFPFMTHAVIRFIGALPPGWIDPFLRRLPTKAADV